MRAPAIRDDTCSWHLPVFQALNPLRAAVKEIGEKVRQLKADDAPKLEIDRAVVELKACRRRLEEKARGFSFPIFMTCSLAMNRA